MKYLINQHIALRIFFAILLGPIFTTFGAQVTFRVNMGIQSSIGRFDDAGDFAEVRGSFDNWGAGLILDPSSQEPGVWEGSIDFFDPVGSDVQYKFVITQPNGTVVWEGFVGDGNQNRAFTLEESDQTLPIAFFDNVSVDPGAGIPVVFQVDMGVQIDMGAFSPETDIIEARGPFNNWGGGFELSNADAGRPTIYQGLMNITSTSPGGSVPYKYVINGGTWEGGDNRTFVLAELEQTLPVRFFDDIEPGSFLTEDTLVTFTVDMTGAVNGLDGSLIGPVNEVYINGDFTPWWNWGSLPGEFAMFDDGLQSLGDQVSGDLVYSWQQVFLAGSPVRLQYRYGVDSEDNEAMPGDDRIRYIRANGNYEMPLDAFGDIVQESRDLQLGGVAIASASGGQVTVTWDGGAGILLQSRTAFDNTDWQEVPNTEAQSSVTLPISNTGHMFFRLTRQ